METQSQKSIRSSEPRPVIITDDKQNVDYAAAVRQYHQYSRGRSMRVFCDEEGYDYGKFCRYARHGYSGQSLQKDPSPAVPSSATGKFIELKVDSATESSSRSVSLSSVMVEFTNGLVLTQKGGEIDVLLEVVKKMLS